MAFLILPMITVLFWLGLSTQAWQMADAVPGAGPAGRMASLAQVSAQQAQMFGTACISAATSNPGVVSSRMAVTLPPGVALPTGAVCMTTAGTGNGRNVYGYVPVAPGAMGRVLSDSQYNAMWHRVQSTGQAVNLATGQAMAVPASIPAGVLLAWVQTSS
ncbi:hypothetical protein JYK21_11405 [Ralstonia pickettii]|nr:hypothetical protein [Ralstonia pickettii]